MAMPRRRPPLPELPPRHGGRNDAEECCSGLLAEADGDAHLAESVPRITRRPPLTIRGTTRAGGCEWPMGLTPILWR